MLSLKSQYLEVMKKISLLFALFFLNCNLSEVPDSSANTFPLTQDFKTYWFDGTAEISSYKLIQSRYSEPREGSAVLIYVTEDFLADAQVKANQKSDKTQTVLKLNRTKNFLTGIYPYSIMSSVFSRLGQTAPLVKTTTSIQEWCGQTYLQLNRKEDIKIESHSYFEGEADQTLTFQEGLTEDELWMWIRTNPNELPQGKLELLPNFEYLRMNHLPIKWYPAEAELIEKNSEKVYTLTFPTLQRKLSIHFEAAPPYPILAWKETDLQNPNLTTYAKRIKTLKLPYWRLNNLGEEHYRDSLGLNPF